jgi:aminocarboxymuconate-semialdehyde decarboxylase
MPNRRDFVKALAVAAAGATVGNRFTYDALAQAAQGAAPKRREVFIGRKRIKVIDSHAHLNIPAVADVVKGTPYARQGNAAANEIIGPERIALMDQAGVDVELLTQQGGFWYTVTDRDLARSICKVQNEGTAAIVAKYPDRFLGMASMPLQFPDIAAEMLEDGVRRLGLKGGGISAGVIPGDKEPSAPEWDVLWAKAQELGVPFFMHPGGDTGTDAKLRGKGGLGNTIGNPLETTIFFSHLIYEGVFDRFPGLKIIGAHAGGYLPSYMGRTDGACVRQPDACSAKKRPVDDYFKTQIMADVMIFRDEGLRHLVAEMGSGQLVYGTDTPFPWPITVDFVLNAKFLTDAQKEMILGGNLIKLLKLAPSATA